MKIEIGQKLYYESIRRGGSGEIKSLTVSKIGKKYFYVSETDRYKFNIETLKYESQMYSQNNIQLYLSEQDILDSNERAKLIEKIRKYFDYSSKIKLGLIELRSMCEVIDTCE